jgi:hypothetical protein
MKGKGKRKIVLEDSDGSDVMVNGGASRQKKGTYREASSPTRMIFLC